MKPFPAREVDAALLRKGFVKRQGDHAYYHFKYRGCDVGYVALLKRLGIISDD